MATSVDLLMENMNLFLLVLRNRINIENVKVFGKTVSAHMAYDVSLDTLNQTGLPTLIL